MGNKTVNRSTGLGFPMFAVAAFLLIAGLTVLAGSVRDGAGAADRSIKTVTLGGGGSLPDPACPVNCQVVASVNGFQTQNPTGGGPFYVPFDGKIKNFRLFLGKPTSSDRSKLNDRFGGPPQAAVTVLKKVKVNGKEKFRLLRKSPVENLGSELGTVATFALSKPLNVRKGNIVALAVPTWAPAFATGLNTGLNRWRASRPGGKCSVAFVDQATSQLKVDSERVYGCTFAGSRLLYTVTITSG
jgi:hypothetical protein